MTISTFKGERNRELSWPTLNPAEYHGSIWKGKGDLVTWMSTNSQVPGKMKDNNSAKLSTDNFSYRKIYISSGYTGRYIYIQEDIYIYIYH